MDEPVPNPVNENPNMSTPMDPPAPEAKPFPETQPAPPPYVPPTTSLTNDTVPSPSVPEPIRPIAQPTSGSDNIANTPPPLPPYTDVPATQTAPQSSIPDSTTFNENTPPNFPVGGEGAPSLSTATILPVGAGGQQAISYSSNSKKKLILPIVIGVLILLVLGAVAFFFFKQSGNGSSSQAEVTPTSTPIPTATGTPTPTPIPMTTYKNSEFNISLDYPVGWAQKEGDLGAVVSFTDPTTTVNPAKIKVLAVTTTSDLKTYITQSQQIAGQLYPGLVQVSSTDTTQGKLPATMLETTYPTKGGVNIHTLQLITLNGGKAFTVSAEVDDANFESMKLTFNQILASFAFTN